jgi:hypothetical protein
MIVTQPQDQQTGSYSRIANPRLRLTPDALYARIHGGTNPGSPTRNPLAGAESVSLLGRFTAWLRGDR